MQQTKLLALLFAFVCVHVHAQEVPKSPLLYKQLHIKSAEGYVYEAREDTLPFLLTVENFNVAGNRTQIDIYDTSGIRSTYAYIFEQDTIYTERRTSFRNKLSSVTKVYHDEKGNIVKYEDFDEKGKKTGNTQTMRYNKKRQVIEDKIFIYNRLVSHKKNQIPSRWQSQKNAYPVSEKRTKTRGFSPAFHPSEYANGFRKQETGNIRKL